MRVLVVDDEPLARKRLVRMLGAIADVFVAGQAGDAATAMAFIERERPDLVFLDIRMRGVSGLELAASAALPPIIFTTAYDQYAVDAFKVSAVDYLLKPVSPERLAAAVDKVRRHSQLRERADIRGLLERLARKQGNALPARLQARCGNTTRLFDAREVMRIHAAEKYAVFRHGGREYVLDESLNALEERLGDEGFLRVHRGELVNLEHVCAVHSEDGATTAELSDGQRAPVSRRCVALLKERLGIR